MQTQGSVQMIACATTNLERRADRGLETVEAALHRHQAKWLRPVGYAIVRHTSAV